MKVKKFLTEQYNMKAQDKLERALALGCFSGKFKADSGPQPKLVDVGGKDVYAVTGSGSPSGDFFYILAEPMIIINVVESQKNPSDRDPKKWAYKQWSCPKLEVNNEQIKYLKDLETKSWVTTPPMTKDLDDGLYIGYDLVSGKKYSGGTLVDLNTGDTWSKEVRSYYPYFKDLFISGNGKVMIYKRNTQVSTFKPEEGDTCRKSIDELVSIKRGRKQEDDAYIENLRKIVQNCVNQRDFTLRPDIRKKVQELIDINPYGELAKFKIVPAQRESLNKIVSKVLREEKERKDNKQIESKIIKSRIDFIIENETKFNSLPRKHKVRKSFNFLNEIHNLRSLGLLQENLTDTFKQIFGKSLDSMVGNVSEPLLNSVFIKVSLPNDVKTQVLEKIKQKSQDLIQNMDSCENLAKFLSNEVAEVLAENMVAKNLFNSELVNSAMADALTDESFKERLAEKMKTQVCELFNKFSTNAQGLVSKLTSPEV